MQDRLLAAVLLETFLLGIGLPERVLYAAPAPPAPLEYQVKAAYLLNFIKFIEWPAAETETPFTICVVGDDPFGTTLDQTVHGENVEGRPIVIQRTGHGLPSGCQMAFISSSELGIKGLAGGVGPGVLTVGDGANFVKQGGMIGFVLENRRVKFEVNLAAARNAGLKVSARLLTVAKRVAE